MSGKKNQLMRGADGRLCVDIVMRKYYRRFLIGVILNVY